MFGKQGREGDAITRPVQLSRINQKAPPIHGLKTPIRRISCARTTSKDWRSLELLINLTRILNIENASYFGKTLAKGTCALSCLTKEIEMFPMFSILVSALEVLPCHLDKPGYDFGRFPKLPAWRDHSSSSSQFFGCFGITAKHARI